MKNNKFNATRVREKNEKLERRREGLGSGAIRQHIVMRREVSE